MLGGILLTVKAFAVALANSLITKGIDKETAVKNVLKITRSLSEDDYKEIASYNGPEDFIPLTEALTKLIDDEKRAEIIREVSAQPVISDANVATKQINVVPSTPTADYMAQTREMDAILYKPQKSAPTPSLEDTREVDVKVYNGSKNKSGANLNETKEMDAVVYKPKAKAAPANLEETKQIEAIVNKPQAKKAPASMEETRQNIPVKTPPKKSGQPSTAETRQIKTTPQNNVQHNTASNEVVRPHYTEFKKTKLTPRGANFFWTIFAITLPLTALAVIAYFGIFALCMISVAALIVGCFILVCAIVIAASLACLISIIYGITQMFVSFGIGLYEIGVGVVVCGVAMIASVLVYLLATRVLPYLMKQLLAFNRHTLNQIPMLVDRARKECNKL